MYEKSEQNVSGYIWLAGEMFGSLPNDLFRVM